MPKILKKKKIDVSPFNFSPQIINRTTLKSIINLFHNTKSRITLFHCTKVFHLIFLRTFEIFYFILLLECFLGRFWRFQFSKTTLLISYLVGSGSVSLTWTPTQLQRIALINFIQISLDLKFIFIIKKFTKILSTLKET